MPKEPRKFSEEQKDAYLARLLDAHCNAVVDRLQIMAEMMSYREAILTIAERCNIDSEQLAARIDERTKHFHHTLLAAMEDKDPWFAAMLDQRRPEDI